MSEVKEAVNMLESFDWNTIGKKQDNYSQAEREKLDAMYGKNIERSYRGSNC